jgi:hypothetical protein
MADKVGAPYLLSGTIEYARYPLSPRIRVLRGILAKFGPAAPRPQARPPTPAERDPGRATKEEGEHRARKRVRHDDLVSLVEPAPAEKPRGLPASAQSAPSTALRGGERRRQ